MSNQRAIAVIEFEGGRRLYGVWVPVLQCLSAQLFREQGDAERHLDCGTYLRADADRARPSAEDVVVRLLGAAESDPPLLLTQASFEHAYITGAYEVTA